MSSVLKGMEFLKKYVGKIQYQSIGSVEPEIILEKVSAGVTRLRFIFDLKCAISQDDWKVEIYPAFPMEYNWANHLAPDDGYVIAQHVFRSPAMIACGNGLTLCLVPDLDILLNTPVERQWYMDVDAISSVLALGMSLTSVPEHVLYKREPGAVYGPGKIEFGFYIFSSEDRDTQMNPFRHILSFLWENWGRRVYAHHKKSSAELEKYVGHTYNWAFESWKNIVWQEFEINNKKVGAPVFIVNVTQSPNYKEMINEREFRSIWNQAWFSSLRSASGLFRYAREKDDGELLGKALMTKELALSAPVKNGFFYGVIATKMNQVEVSGRKYKSSQGWNTMFWGNSNRNPFNTDVSKSPFHILDMSHTALTMVRWYNELEKDERLIQYAEQYAEALVGIQDIGGFFPAWLDLETLQPLEVLDNSPETSLSGTFLAELYQTTGKQKYLDSALKAINAVCRDIIPSGRWEDFETYWSCCRYGQSELVGKKIKRNNMFKQCNFSMFWTAEALYRVYKITGQSEFLRTGQRCLDEMLMTQASWQPNFIYVDAFGSFGVMNCDGEWLDARQSLFAEIILIYGRELGCEEYIQRGLAALSASFGMMYCPENEQTKRQWEKVWPFFGPEDYGFTMENYGHCGKTSPDGLGIGEFTIYDWGNGAAAEAFLRIRDHFGNSFMDNQDK